MIKMNSIKQFGVSLLIMVVAVACLVGFSKQVYAETPKYGGILKIITTRSPRAIGWPSSSAGPEIVDYFPCFQPLTKINDMGEPVPFLATAWEYGPDLKTLTLTIRKGVKFHDGSDLNAKVVKMNIDERKKGMLGSDLKTIESVDVIDEYTVRLNLSEFVSSLLEAFAGFNGFMVSPNVIEKVQKEKKGKKWAKKNPVGTGPFKFVKFQRDVILKWERFDGYWEKGKPYLDGIETHYIKDKITSVTSLRAGEAHIMWETPAKQAKELKSAGYLLSVSRSGLRSLAGDSKNPESIFSNMKIREAVEYAINKRAITEGLFYGFWEPANQCSPVEANGYNPDLIGRPYNPDKARQLLKEAGYPNGFKTKIIANIADTTKNAMEAVQQDLKKVGIDASIELNDPGKYRLSLLMGHKNALLFFGTSVPRNLTKQLNGLYKDGSVRLPVLYRPAELQEILTKADKEPDFKIQRSLIKKSIRMLSDEAVVIPLWSFVTITAMHKSVRDPHFGGEYNFWRPGDAWLSE
ncbi:MAG: ABC transporter substrate-binding protein [Deltaproteobacteria bacterium]|nr:ABC transporter substrate-binding protein [Deltaproteobacteria bacterium]